jgi:hypothetical protein
VLISGSSHFYHQETWKKISVGSYLKIMPLKLENVYVEEPVLDIRVVAPYYYHQYRTVDPLTNNKQQNAQQKKEYQQQTTLK